MLIQHQIGWFVNLGEVYTAPIRNDGLKRFIKHVNGFVKSSSLCQQLNQHTLPGRVISSPNFLKPPLTLFFFLHFLSFLFFIYFFLFMGVLIFLVQIFRICNLLKD